MSERINKRIVSPWTCLLATALALTACTQDELPGGEELSGDPRPLVISSVGIAGEHTDTKVYDSDFHDEHRSQWDGGEIISVKMDDGTPCLYEVGANGTVKEQDGQTIYWPDRKEHTITAWFPQEAMNEGEVIDLSKQSTEGLTYVLKAETPENYTQQGIDLNFEHQLAKVRVKLEKKNYEGDFSDDATVTLHNVPTSVVIENRKVKAGATGDIQLYKDTKNYDGTFYEATLAPDTELKSLTVKMKEGEFDVQLTDIPSLRAGEVRLITVNISNVFIVESGETLTIKDYTGTSPIRVDDGAMVILENVQIETELALEVASGSPTIRIKGENSLTSLGSSTSPGNGGINFGGDYGVITIEGCNDDRTQNKLTVQGGPSGSGIGSVANGSKQSITIRNCTVVANVGQGDSPAAIGSREGSSCGDIVIENCEITTNAAIGSGKQGQCGDITIKNSTITTNGGGVGGYGTHGTIKYIKSTVDGTYYENETIPATP